MKYHKFIPPAVMIFAAGFIPTTFGQAPPAYSPVDATPPAYQAVPVKPKSEKEKSESTVKKEGKAEDQFKILSLVNANAEAMATQIMRLMDGSDSKFTIVPDPRTNQLLLRGHPEALRVIEMLAQKLDETDSRQPEKSSQKTPGGAGDKRRIEDPDSYGPAASSSGLPPGFGGGMRGPGFGGAASGSTSAGFPSSTGGGGSGGGGFSAGGWASTAGSLEAADKALREADAASKRADAKMKDMIKFLEEHQGAMKDGNSPELSQLYEQMRQNVEELRRDAEKQRRQAEDQRRAIEQDRRPIKDYANLIPGPQSEDDKQTQALTAMIKDLAAKKNLGDVEKQELAALKAKLHATVSAKFDQQLKDQSQELKQMRERLDRLEKEINTRSQNKDSMIDRRMEDLLAAKSDSSMPKARRVHPSDSDAGAGTTTDPFNPAPPAQPGVPAPPAAGVVPAPAAPPVWDRPSAPIPPPNSEAAETPAAEPGPVPAPAVP